MLLAAHILEKEQEKAFAKGLELGIRKGRAEAYEYVARQMESYHERMRAALDAGESFDEPPPRFRRNGR